MKKYLVNMAVVLAIAAFSVGCVSERTVTPLSQSTMTEMMMPRSFVAPNGIVLKYRAYVPPRAY